MLGLMYIGAAALYLLLLVAVVGWCWRKGRAGSGSLWRGLAFAVVGFLTVYLPVFWNHIPVVLEHRALCETDAGFTIHVSPEKWVADNRDQLRQLAGVDLDTITSESEAPSPGVFRYRFFGGLLAMESSTKRWEQFGLSFSRYERRVVDMRSGAAMTRSIDYSAGSREDARLWLPRLSCFDTEAEQPAALQGAYKEQLRRRASGSL